MKIHSDYHVHSVSPDAQTPMEDMCRAALERGIDEIAFTDHFELYSPEYRSGEARYFDRDYMDAYFRKLEACREAVQGKMTVRAGVELGQATVNPQKAQWLLKKYSFDFVLGSLHKIHDVDLCYKVYTPQTMPALLEENMTAMEQFVREADFDVMGHIDLIRRYSNRRGLDTHLLECQRERLEQVLRELIRREKGIEINTSGLRQGLGETLPSLDILRRYRELGGEILTVGSDAHRSEDVGAGFETARELALAAGFRYLASFEGRKPTFYALEN